jgi:hypothetical protein
MLRRGDRYEDKDRDGNGFMVGVFVQGCVCCSVRLTEMQWAFWNGDT